MKTHTIKTLTAELLVVEMPRECDFNLYQDRIYIYDHETKEEKSIDGSYIFLGRPDEIKESDAMELVQKISFGFKNYKSKEIEFFLHAKQSLLSAIDSDIYWVNPFKKPDNYNLWAKYGDYTQYGVGLTTESLKWHKAEQKTFDRKRTLIFVKN